MAFISILVRFRKIYPFGFATRRSQLGPVGAVTVATESVFINTQFKNNLVNFLNYYQSLKS